MITVKIQSLNKKVTREMNIHEISCKIVMKFEIRILKIHTNVTVNGFCALSSIMKIVANRFSLRLASLYFDLQSNLIDRAHPLCANNFCGTAITKSSIWIFHLFFFYRKSILECKRKSIKPCCLHIILHPIAYCT